MLSTGTPKPPAVIPRTAFSRSGHPLIVESDLDRSTDRRTTVDRNEVLLVGRLSAPAEDHPLPSGDTLTKWRIIVRRRRHRRGATLSDSIPCITFDADTAAVVRAMKPRDLLEVMGSFRCRVYGPSTGKRWRYEVEVSSAKPYEQAEPADPTTTPADAAAAEPVTISASDAVAAPAHRLADLIPLQVPYLAPTG
ncbi:single-stranded DNA-binding protein [Nonomuraea sp. PA05]|uniref:single-stranded DNA-binding protein n=1 Tax=Nonomuraea sp. PA05 TaxID=2604466 RepID=UPI0011D70188|nr:single-stranded DNA-binding protein [Nonomuraea sp. PA05]TYB70423.1 single-stranded DNA-binding protein [Nonomuraea sp. PA05]